MFDQPNKVNVTQCTHYATNDETVLCAAVLGSCVAVCAHDPVLKIGGMNHILLPGKSDAGDPRVGMFGTNLMELLLNDLIKMGASKNRMEFKIFGGARLLNSSADAGTNNAKFIMEFAENEALNVISSSLGGDKGRRVEFHPATGKSRQKFLSDTGFPEPVAKPVKVEVESSGDMELF